MRIRSLAFLIFSPSFFACQEIPENGLPLAAGLVFQPATSAGQVSEKPLPPSATDLIFQSNDGGLTWQDVSTGLPEGFEVGCVFAGSGGVFLGSENGLFRSNSDAAAAPVWKKETFLGQKVGAIFAGRSGPYFYSSGKGIFQGIPGLDIWKSVTSNLQSQAFRTIFENPDGSVFVGTDNGIFKSSDGGKNWKQVVSQGWVLKIVESGGTLICTNERGILRSTDGGENWDVVLAEGGVGIDVQPIEGGFAAITYNTDSKTRRVRTSADGGKTWQPIDAGLSPSDMISEIKQAGDYLFCSHPEGLFRSADRGRTWELVFAPTGKDKVFRLAVSGRTVFAVSVPGGGC